MNDPWPNLYRDDCPDCGSDDISFYGVEPQFGRCNECGESVQKDLDEAIAVRRAYQS